MRAIWVFSTLFGRFKDLWGHVTFFRGLVSDGYAFKGWTEKSPFQPSGSDSGGAPPGTLTALFSALPPPPQGGVML